MIDPVRKNPPPPPKPPQFVLPKPGESGWNAPNSPDNCARHPGKKACQ